MKTEIVALSFLPAGYGHYKFTVNVDSEDHVLTSPRVDLVDAIRGADESDEKAEAARIAAVKMVLDADGVEYTDVRTEYSTRYGKHIVVDF